MYRSPFQLALQEMTALHLAPRLRLKPKADDPLERRSTVVQGGALVH